MAAVAMGMDLMEIVELRTRSFQHKATMHATDETGQAAFTVGDRVGDAVAMGWAGRGPHKWVFRVIAPAVPAFATGAAIGAAVGLATGGAAIPVIVAGIGATYAGKWIGGKVAGVVNRRIDSVGAGRSEYYARRHNVMTDIYITAQEKNEQRRLELNPLSFDFALGTMQLMEQKIVANDRRVLFASTIGALAAGGGFRAGLTVGESWRNAIDAARHAADVQSTPSSQGTAQAKPTVQTTPKPSPTVQPTPKPTGTTTPGTTTGGGETPVLPQQPTNIPHLTDHEWAWTHANKIRQYLELHHMWHGSSNSMDIVRQTAGYLSQHPVPGHHFQVVGGQVLDNGNLPSWQSLQIFNNGMDQMLNVAA